MKQLLISLLVLGTTATLYAQRKQYSLEEKAQYYTKQMVDSLQLSTEQEKKVYTINLQVSKSIDSIYALKLESKVGKKAMVPIFKLRNEQYKEVLSTIQFLKYDDMEREKRERKKKQQEASE